MPLILFPIIVLYIIFVIWGTVNTVVRQKTTKKKWLFGILIPLVFFVGPFADEFIARPYFYSLCNSNGGLRVYEKVEISYVDENWYINILEEAKVKEVFDINDAYMWVFEETKDYDSIFNIRVSEISIVKKSNSKKISSYHRYIYDYGMLINFISGIMPDNPIKCHDISERVFENIIRKTFVKGIG